ncbi:MAG TPA: lipase family protein [Solirubrobacteraceae bacterium]|nr:lipase family protein [Solirubrobacteraceae bacterium]
MAAAILAYAALATVALASSGAPARAATAPAGTSAAHAHAAVLPSRDPFYRWKRPLAKVAPGTVLRRRTVTLSPAVGGVATAIQVLYRTTTQLGAPAATVATIIRPPAARATKIVSYQTAYDALGAQCDPSYTLAGGNRSSGSAETAVMAQFVARGDTVVVSDYEGEDLAYGAGQQSGYGTLDGIRAAEHALRASARAPVAMIGYSGGSIATEFAAELAHKYAPRLRIAGVAAGGVPVDLAHNLRYVDGSKVWSSATPGVLLGVGRAYKIDMNRYASAYGRKVFKQVRHQCLGQYLGRYPGLRVAQLFRPGFKHPVRVPAFATITNHLIMGSSGTPKGPILLGVGNADGTGDGVMVAKDVAGLANEYCGRGVSVTFHEYVGDDHAHAAPPFLLAAVPFLQTRLNGGRVANGCRAVPRGNSLAPLALPHYKMTLGRAGKHGAPAVLRSRGGAVADAVIKLSFGRRHVQTVRRARVSPKPTRFMLKLHKPGRYVLTLNQAGIQLWRVPIRLRLVASSK